MARQWELLQSEPVKALRPYASRGNGLKGTFVRDNEVSHSHRKFELIGGGERIDAQLTFEAHDQHSEGKRIKTGFISTRSSLSGANLWSYSLATLSISAMIFDRTDIGIAYDVAPSHGYNGGHQRDKLVQ